MYNYEEVYQVLIRSRYGKPANNGMWAFRDSYAELECESNREEESFRALHLASSPTPRDLQHSFSFYAKDYPRETFQRLCVLNCQEETPFCFHAVPLPREEVARQLEIAFDVEPSPYMNRRVPFLEGFYRSLLDKKNKT